MASYVGVDLGATNLRAAVGTPDGEILGRYRRSTPQGPAGLAVTEAILEAVRTACADADVDPGDVTAAGVASIGPLDETEGAVVDPANLPDTIDRVPITGPIGNLVDGPVYLHNDANAGVIGERFHADYSPDNLAYLTISSGIGAGVIVDGTVLAGWDGNAGEIGHVTVDPQGTLTCGCGRPGHWEAYCAGTNIPAFARTLHDGEPTALPLADESFSAADVFDAAGSDPLADRVLERMAAYNAQGLAMLTHAYAPIVIYAGGAVATNNPALVVDPLRSELADRVITNVPEIELTTLGEDVVLEGALASAMTQGTGNRDLLSD